MHLDFTVAIPTYNGADRLPLVLERLLSQTEIEQLSWEIIIVDNNSTDTTAQLIHNYQSNWKYPFSIGYIKEPQQGAAYARSTAIREAKGEIIGFLDDDNLPASNWVISAYKFAQNHPQAGAIASQIHGAFASEPSPNLQPILFYLAITERGNKPHLYEPRRQGFPPSAGLVVRKIAWQENVPRSLVLVGRIGTSMLGSEDAESLFYIHKAGWEIWYNPDMEVDHIIPSWRLEREYLIALMHGVGLARYHLRMLLIPTWQKPLFFLLYLINDTRKVILHFLRYRAVISTDIIAATEMARLLATFLSPLYIWRLKINNLLHNKSIT